MHISSISFTANERNSQAEIENKKKKVGEAAVGTSAVAAAGNRAGFKMFKSTKKMGYLSQEVVDNIKFANKPIKETKSLFGKFGKMAKGFADGITNWVQKAPVIGKVVKSKLFLGTASFLGFGLAVLTLLTGLTNIVKASTTAYSDHIEKSKFLNSLDENEEE
ncbi:TPA: hypothetical protein IAD41_09505 [Candidatus Scatenecus faecavium]|uniref:Uncharacterized protein n=1 Tax=Candidatus Scatenecus faecavium TaxID=2840915 RepID=A0A9D1FY23_9BACT|nr:hypothetical protein [Candidatus Scatenecus faecavium]